jgi:hypothetical protein
MIKVDRANKTVTIFKKQYTIQSFDELNDWLFLFQRRLSKTKNKKTKMFYKSIMDLLFPIRRDFENEKFYQNRS